MRLGSMCSGAGMLDYAVEEVFGATTVWHCEIDAAASKVLEHRWPGVPNHRDLINTDWTTVEPIDILCFGWPCQPWSAAGKQLGAADERAIWPHIADAIRILRPRICVMENVPTIARVGELERVANSMARIGYDLRWTCLRASDVGAPHQRKRIFIIAHAADAERGGGSRSAQSRGSGTAHSEGRQTDITGGCGSSPADSCGGRRLRDTQLDSQPETDSETSQHRRHPDGRNVETAADSSGDGRHQRRPGPTQQQRRPDAALRGDGPVNLLPTPRSSRGASSTETMYTFGGKRDDTNRPQGEVLLLTPRTSDTNGAGHHGDGGMDLRTTVSLLPTPKAHRRGDCESERNRDNPALEAVTHHFPGGMWGKYAPAIHRWEQIVGPAPAPTEPNRNGKPRLNPAFSEWMMGWPAGWVTDVPGISRNDALKIIGNGCVPQQVAAALQFLLSLEVVA